MNFSFVLLFLAFLEAAEGSGKLSPLENQNLQGICGTKPLNSIAKPNSFRSNSQRRSLYGGRLITGDMAPWAVQIEVENGGMCSGTLISSRHILTASHCVWEDDNKKSPWMYYSNKECDGQNLILTQNNDLWKVFGSNGRPLSINVSKMILMNYCTQPHWRYDDIMIWELKEDVAFDDYVHPACVLANWQYMNTHNLYLTGFGHNSYYEQNDDQKGTKALRDGFMTYSGMSNEGRTLNLLSENQTTASRPGDSGSGAFITLNSRFFIVGVCSGGEQFSAMYANVVGHYNQICQYTGICWI